MRILEILGSVDPREGGAAEGVLRQSTRRARDGFETHIVSLDEADAPWVRNCPVQTFALGTYNGSRRAPLLQRYSYTPHLVPWLRQHVSNYDAVIVNGLWNYTAFAARRVLPTAGVPYVVFTHGMLDPWFRIHNPVKHMAKQMLWFASEGPLLANAGAVLFTTAAEMELASSAFWPYRARGRVVGYGTADIEGDPATQIAAFRRAVPSLGNRPFLLFLSRIHPKKGCDILVEAFTGLAAQYPDIDLVVAGPDPMGLRSAIEAPAKASGISERIHWPGMISGDVKWGALRDCMALVLPSHSENFGIVVAEALAAGRPVLISNRVNIWQEIETDGAGMICMDDLEDTSRMLRDFLGLTDQAIEHMGRAARACFLAHFEVGMATKAVCSVLEDVRKFSQAGRAMAPAQ